MKVRILSGNQRGQIIEQERTEAESNIATGYAELVIEEAPSVVVTPAPVERSRDRRERARKPSEDGEDE